MLTDWQPGTKVVDAAGAVTIDGLLARGGGGRVYAAHEHGQPVVVKAPETWDQTIDLLHECRCLGIQRPRRHVVCIQRVLLGDGPDGLPVPALVLPRYRSSLADRLDRDGAVPVPQAARWMIQVCDALADRPLLHRDLKPENLLLDDADDCVVADYGIALPANPWRRRQLGIRSGGLVGTAIYMAPEQIGEAEDLDARVDIYACGLIFFELVTGRLARPSRSQGESLDDYLDRLLDWDPPLEELPVSCRPIVAGCCARRRAERFPDCLVLRRALQGLRGTA